MAGLRGCILALILCAMALIGCADEGPLAKDGGAANASTSDEYVLASSYDEIYQAVYASLEEDADALSFGNEDSSDTQQAASLAFEEFVSEVDVEDSLTDEELLTEFSSLWDLSILVTAQSSLSTAESSDTVTVEDESGYAYVAEGKTLSVLSTDDSSAESVAQLSMSSYDELERWESTSALYLEGDTLAVVGSLYEDTDWDPDAPDYALSAYAGARVMVAFFDVSDPADPDYLSAVGVSGVLLGFEENDGVLTVVASHSAVPAVSSTAGSWLVVDDDEDTEADSEAEAAVDGDASTEANSATDTDTDDDTEGSNTDTGDSDTDTEDSDDAATTTSSALPTRQEVADRLELRCNDAVSYVPAVYQDGALTPVAADRVYLPADGSGAIATVVATIDLEAQTVDSAFAVYSDELELPTVTMGEGVAYLQWMSSYADEETETFGASTFIMRVPLEGATLSGVVGMARLLVLNDYVYVMSFETDSATVYVCDASTFEVVAEIPLEDEAVLSEDLDSSDE